jgi:hypothetical protein
MADEYWTFQVRKSTMKAVARMFGTFLRDGGILVLVFGILDKYNSLTREWVYGCTEIGLGAFVVGLILGLIGGE